MDGGGAPKTGLRISFILLGVAIVLIAVCYVYSRWDEAQRQQELLPRLAADSMVKGLRQYQRQTAENAVRWARSPSPYSSTGCAHPEPNHYQESRPPTPIFRPDRP